MNLTFMEMTDKGLASMRDMQDTIGREARREIKRREQIGYADGTMFMTAKAQVEIESRVGTVTIATPTARKVEKRMAGRGR